MMIVFGRSTIVTRCGREFIVDRLVETAKDVVSVRTESWLFNSLGPPAVRIVFDRSLLLQHHRDVENHRKGGNRLRKDWTDKKCVRINKVHDVVACLTSECGTLGWRRGNKSAGWRPS